MRKYYIHTSADEADKLQYDTRGPLGRFIGRLTPYLAAVLCWTLAYLLDHACSPVARSAPPTIEPFAARRQADAVDYSLLVCSAPPETVPASMPLRPLGLLLLGAPTETESRRTVSAIDGCQWTNRQVADPWLVLALLRLEEAAGAPWGVLSAVWCREASMRTVGAVTRGPVAGDVRNGRPTSIGPFQMQGWWLKWCGWRSDLRGNFLQAANCYLARTIHFLQKSEAECGAEAAWRVSEAMAANGLKYGPRGCAARSQHWDILERLHDPR